MNNKVIAAKERIDNGAKFNGTIYCKRINRNNVEIQIYLDGGLVPLMRVSPEHAEEVKSEVEEYFNYEQKTEKTAGMSYGDIYEMFGFDVAEEG